MLLILLELTLLSALFEMPTGRVRASVLVTPIVNGIFALDVKVDVEELDVEELDMEDVEVIEKTDVEEDAFL